MINQQSPSEQPGSEEKPAGQSSTAASGPATIQMSLYLVVSCPHCGKDHNLASSEFDDECQFTSAVFKDSYDWRDGLRGMEFGCPDCNKTIQLGDIQY
jgi:predicted RNA-binding Zn-ribbon protein involved in translation (DUF1610 family)